MEYSQCQLVQDFIHQQYVPPCTKTLQHPLNCGNPAVRKTSTNTPENEKQNSKAPENGWQKVDDQASRGKRLIFSVVNSLLVFRDPFPAFGSLILLIGSGIELSIKK